MNFGHLLWPTWNIVRTSLLILSWSRNTRMWFCPVSTKTFNLFYFQNIAKGGIATRRSSHYSPKNFKYSKFSLYPLQWLVNSVPPMIIFDVLPCPLNYNTHFQDVLNPVLSQFGKITRKLKNFFKIFENCGCFSCWISYEFLINKKNLN